MDLDIAALTAWVDGARTRGQTAAGHEVIISDVEACQMVRAACGADPACRLAVGGIKGFFDVLVWRIGRTEDTNASELAIRALGNAIVDTNSNRDLALAAGAINVLVRIGLPEADGGTPYIVTLANNCLLALHNLNVDHPPSRAATAAAIASLRSPAVSADKLDLYAFSQVVNHMKLFEEENENNDDGVPTATLVLGRLAAAVANSEQRGVWARALTMQSTQEEAVEDIDSIASVLLCVSPPEALLLDRCVVSSSTTQERVGEERREEHDLPGRSADVGTDSNDNNDKSTTEPTKQRDEIIAETIAALVTMTTGIIQRSDIIVEVITKAVDIMLQVLQKPDLSAEARHAAVDLWLPALLDQIPSKVQEYLERYTLDHDHCGERMDNAKWLNFSMAPEYMMLKCLALLSQCPGGGERIARHGGNVIASLCKLVHHIVKLPPDFESISEALDSCSLIFAVLGYAAGSPEDASRIVEEGGMDACLAALSTPVPTTYTRTAAQLARNLCLVPSCRRKVREKGAVSMLLRACHANKTHADVAAVTAASVRILLTDSVDDDCTASSVKDESDVATGEGGGNLGIRATTGEESWRSSLIYCDTEALQLCLSMDWKYVHPFCRVELARSVALLATRTGVDAESVAVARSAEGVSLVAFLLLAPPNQQQLWDEACQALIAVAAAANSATDSKADLAGMPLGDQQNTIADRLRELSGNGFAPAQKALEELGK